MATSYLESVTREFRYYKHLADKSIEQLNDEQLNWQPNEQSNSISTLVQHMSGNMLSRFTNFMTDDGEKPWRNRDEEFRPAYRTRENLKKLWENGWLCLFDALEKLTHEQLETIVYIRNQGHTVTEALNRQVAHYSYHVGQIVFIAKMLVEQWKYLSIAPNASVQFNANKFAKEKTREHFTSEVLKDEKKSG